jgi:nitrate reductase gamma subunit
MNNVQWLNFVEYDLQAIALTWMATVYAIKAYKLCCLPMPWEKAPARGSARLGAASSYTSILNPWSRESSRHHKGRWLEFGIYHVGALAAIINTFTLPFAPQLMTEPVKVIFAVLIAPAIVVGFIKIGRRIRRPELRIVSTPDDFFALGSLQLFFFFAVMALLVGTPAWLFAYYLVTALFLFYVPFSKISHYIYFFFSHYLTGRRYGWRGVPSGRIAQ